MRVKGLIEILSKMPADALILVDGYEEGLSDIVEPKLVSVDLNVHSQDYYGPHDESPNGKEKAVVLHRKPNHIN